MHLSSTLGVACWLGKKSSWVERSVETSGVKILGFAGSLRKGSYNRMLLNAASELLPGDAELEKFDLEGIPPFNADF